MKILIFLLSFIFFMCSCSGTTNELLSNAPKDSTNLDSLDSINLDSINKDTIDTADVDTLVKDTSDTNAAVLDTIPKDTSKVDTIYNLNLVSDTVMDGRYRTIYLVPDNRIYGTQMFSFTPTEFWTSPPKGVSGFGGSAFEILGTTVILRENNKQLDSINIVVSSDSLINCYIPPYNYLN